METFVRIFSVCFWGLMLVLYGILFIICLPLEAIQQMQEESNRY